MMPRRADVLQVGRFGLVGLLATAVHYGLALPVTWLAGPYAGNAMGYLAAVAISYLGHHSFTFRVSAAARNHGRRLRRFLVTSLSALLLSQGVLWVAQQGSTPEELALLIAVFTVPAVTFSLGRLWVFA